MFERKVNLISVVLQVNHEKLLVDRVYRNNGIALRMLGGDKPNKSC